MESDRTWDLKRLHNSCVVHGLRPSRIRSTNALIIVRSATSCASTEPALTRSKSSLLRRSCEAAELALLRLAALGFSCEELGRWQDRHHPFRIGRSVDVGGRSLNIDCSGSGRPAVIFEAGGSGHGGYGWSMVQRGVATFTTACWYDRAGEAWSDPRTDGAQQRHRR